MVTTQNNCVWTATTTATWLHITNAQNYISTGTVVFTIDQNTSSQIRTGTISVGDATTQQTVTITQIAGNCNFQLAPPLSANYPVTGGSGAFQVTAGCSWTASANQSWITLTAPTGAILGAGSGAYTVGANSCVAGRSGAITINTGAAAPPTLAITQDGSQGNLTIAPTSASFGAAAGAGRFTVTTGDGCSWSASPPDVNWLTITANSSTGSGQGAVTFSYTANVGPSRTGHISIGTQVFTITQAGVAAPSPVLSAIINSASGATGPISPGEIVSLFGTGMGPAAGVAFGSTIQETLGGVQVMFGNLPAPLTYVSAVQINAVVPYGVSGQTSVPVQVQYQGQPSNIIAATVQAATPAIFSLDFSGAGQGAILNSNYVTNSISNPAVQGSVVMIYGTGGGITSPASTDGGVAPLAEPFARLTQQVSVTIGGAAAQVMYAGGAPGLVNGLLQLNVVVPAGIATGVPVPVVLRIGNWQSQAGITLYAQ